jgi:hypothetical protein
MDATCLRENDDDEEGRVDKFPLAEEKKYAFTFKHMIHKLYKEDDWLRTVKEVLEKSKKDFKPLADCGLNQNPSRCVDSQGGGGWFRDVPPTRVGRRASGTVKGRGLRRLSLKARHGANTSLMKLSLLLTARSKDVDEPQADDEPVRALKKRCVGIIRKSTSGNPSRCDGTQDETRKSGREGSFVFASSISSAEGSGQEIYLHFPSPQVSPSESCFSSVEQDTTAPHSPISPISPSPTSSTTLYTTDCAAGMKRRVGVNRQVVVLNAVPPGRLTEKNVNRLSSRLSSQDQMRIPINRF